MCARNQNDIQYVAEHEISSINKRGLIEKLTHDYEQNSEIAIAVLYTYQWYFTERELFTMLLERFKTPIPLNLSPIERQLLLDNVISKV